MRRREKEEEGEIRIGKEKHGGEQEENRRERVVESVHTCSMNLSKTG